MISLPRTNFLWYGLVIKLQYKDYEILYIEFICDITSFRCKINPVFANAYLTACPAY